jgi:hypothetical protein
MEIEQEELYQLFGLKVEPLRNHHYIISIGIHPATASMEQAGKFYLKYRPIHFTNDDILNVAKARTTIEDRVFKTKPDEAMKMFNCQELIHNLTMISQGSAANNCTLHHFSADFEIEEDYFEMLADLANKFPYERELIARSRIGGGVSFV